MTQNRIANNIKQAIVAVLVSVFAILAPAAPVLAQEEAAAPTTGSKGAICEGIGLTGTTSGCEPTNAQSSVNNTLKNVINFISFLVGVISVIMIIIGGLKYITSAGDSSKVSSAKDTILYAIIGLVVVATSQILVQFVVGKV